MSRLVAVLALALAGCAALAPRENRRLDEAIAAVAAARTDAQVRQFAPAELAAAEEMLERALRAQATLQDPAEVDHLAYVARQRAEISRYAAQLAARDRRAPGPEADL